MSEKPKRRPRCKWISWDDKGRPSCEHGSAIKHGDTWTCGMKERAINRRNRGSNVPLYAPALSHSEVSRRGGRSPEEMKSIARRGRAASKFKRLYDDPVALAMIEERRPRQAKLIRLAFHPATPKFEKQRALDKLIPTISQED